MVTNSNKTNLAENISGVAGSDPADISIMFEMAQSNNLDIKIVDDPDYVLTPEDIANGTSIIVYKKGENGEIGHYMLKKSNGEVIDFNSSNNNCGYDVIGSLTGTASSRNSHCND